MMDGGERQRVGTKHVSYSQDLQALLKAHHRTYAWSGASEHSPSPGNHNHSLVKAIAGYDGTIGGAWEVVDTRPLTAVSQ